MQESHFSERRGSPPPVDQNKDHSGVPGDPLLCLDDLMALYSGQTGLEFEFVQLAPGHLGYGHTSVTIGDVTISSERVGKQLRVRLRTPPGIVSISFMLDAGGLAFWHGHEIDTSHALVFGEAANDYILPAGMRSLNVSAQASAFDRLGLPRPQGGLWRTVEAPRRLVTSAGRALLAGRPVSPGTDVRLLVGMCDALAEAQGALSLAADREDGPTRRFHLLQRAERMEPDLASLSLDAMADGLSTSKRSLHRTFKDLTGLGPQSYLRILRLHQFRKRLVAGETDETITRLAYDHGFENMGRLSRQYRDWFGELPRETRRRQGR